ncbi:MAG: aminopeptidase N [Planctomycetota bacterium]|jgi:aminopeptidase N
MHLRPALLALTLAVACFPSWAAAGPQIGRTPAPVAHARASEDLRELYDVGTYLLHLELDPKNRILSGVVAMEATTTASKVRRVALDLFESWEVQSVELLEGKLSFEHDLSGLALAHKHVGDHLFIDLPRPYAAEEHFRVAVRYAGTPPAPLGSEKRKPEHGFFWGTSKDGSPRVDVSCQYVGSHSWWPCKAAYFHPEDKPDRVLVALTVPEDLTAVSVGNLVSTSKPKAGKRTWRWSLDAPTPTWAVGFAVGPYTRIDQEVYLSGLKKPLSLSFYACPENVERARAQLATVPQILEVYSERFGPYPYPHNKLAIVDSLAASSAGATLVSYGSNYPAWNAREEVGVGKPECEADAGLDPILAHELAHIWWGQSVSARSWKDVWLHESFANYGVNLVREDLLGRDAADEDLFGWQTKVSSKSRVFPGEDAAYSSQKSLRSAIWLKGPLVLNQLRHYVDDDQAWFGALREMQSKHHLGFADTADLIALLEYRTGQNWSPYFNAWYYGSGRPRVDGVVYVMDNELSINANNEWRSGKGSRVPLDLVWFEGELKRKHRVWLRPGNNQYSIETKSRPQDVEIVNLERLLARIAVKPEDH